MTTPTDKPTSADTMPFTVSVWDIVPCFLWAAVVLGIQAWWLWARDLEMGAPFYLGTAILGLGSLVLFSYASLRHLKAKGDAGRLAALDSELRPLLALAALVAGVVLLLLATWLCLAEKEKLQVFAEVSSLAVMGLICVGGGLALRTTPRSPLSRQVLLQALLHVRNQLGLGLTIVGLALGGFGIFLLVKGGLENFPEGLGLLSIALVLVSAGLWTQLTLARPATIDTMRLLVLYVGSLTGLCIALFTAVRVAMWWRTYFAGGVSAWQGENGWRFWLCAYIELAGLFLLFASLLLARADIRANVGMRRLLYGYNAVLTGILLLAVLVVLDIIVYVKLPSNVEWTATMGMYSLSETTATTLASLKQKVTVFVVMSRNSLEFSDVHDLLDNCEDVTNKLKAKYVSPDLDVEGYRELAKTYPEVRAARPNEFGIGGASGRGLLVVYGDVAEGEKAPHEFVAEKDLEEGGGFDPGGGSAPRAFKGEQVLVQTIQQLAEKNKKPKVYFTQLSGELLINDAPVKLAFDNRILADEFRGIGTLVSKLKKDNYEVQGLVWEAGLPLNRVLPGEQVTVAAQEPQGKKELSKETVEVPKDCKVLVIADPCIVFSKAVLEAIDRYLDRGGKVMALTRAGILPNGQYNEDSMGELCKKLNVELTNDFIVKYATKNFDVLLVKANVPKGTTNKVASQFARNSFTFFMPRTLRPGKEPGQFKAEVILEVTEQVNGPVWVESKSPLDCLRAPAAYVSALRLGGKLQDKASPDPLPVGVAVTDRENHPQAIILGDDAFITSDYMAEHPAETANYEFFRSCLEWLGERPVAVIGGIRPKERQFYRLSRDDVNGGSRLILLPMSLMVLTLAGLGTGIWIVRRK